MKKVLTLAMFCLLAGCYTPISNSGVMTNKPWLDVSTVRKDFDGQQYDSCVQFNIRFWPQEAAERINLTKSCISACCWRSEQNEIVLDFNKNFEEELAAKGRARKYSPRRVTLKVTHSNFVNLTKVKVTPQGAINNKGLLKLTYQEVTGPVLQVPPPQEEQEFDVEADEHQIPVFPSETKTKKAVASSKKKRKRTTSSAKTAGTAKTAAIKTNAEESEEKTENLSESERAKRILQEQEGTQIDSYFYQMNRNYRDQGAVFILSGRLLQASTYGNGIYLINCHAKARTGVDGEHLNASDFPCGKWLVDVSKELITPYDTKARIISKDY